MKTRLLMTAALVAASLQANAQTLATEFKGTSDGNPISPCVFCADPTSLEYNGRLYVYGSNDHQQFILNNKTGDNGYGGIKSMVVFSTADMVNWTFHGTIDAQKVCSNWTGNPWYKGFMNSWAPSVMWRTNPSTGKDEFFRRRGKSPWIVPISLTKYLSTTEHKERQVVDTMHLRT